MLLFLLPLSDAGAAGDSPGPGEAGGGGAGGAAESDRRLATPLAPFPPPDTPPPPAINIATHKQGTGKYIFI